MVVDAVPSIDAVSEEAGAAAVHAALRSADAPTKAGFSQESQFSWEQLSEIIFCNFPKVVFCKLGSSGTMGSIMK